MTPAKYAICQRIMRGGDWSDLWLCTTLCFFEDQDCGNLTINSQKQWYTLIHNTFAINFITFMKINLN